MAAGKPGSHSPLLTAAVATYNTTTGSNGDNGASPTSPDPTDNLHIRPSSSSSSFSEQRPTTPISPTAADAFLPMAARARTEEEMPEAKEEFPRNHSIDHALQHAARPKLPRSRNYYIWTTFIVWYAAVAGSLLYFEPALDFGDRNGGGWQKWMQVIFNPFSALFVTLTFGRFFYNRQEDIEDIQHELKADLDPEKTAVQKRKEDRGMFLISLTSAFPLAAPAFQVSALSFILRAIKAVLVFIAYAIQHRLPIQLLLYDALTRLVMLFPFKPFIYLAKIFRKWYEEDYKKDHDANYNRGLREQTRADQQKLKDALVNAVGGILQKLLKQGFRAETPDGKVRFQFPPEIQKLGHQLPTSVEGLIKLIDDLGKYEAVQLPGTCGKLTRRGLWFVGATTMTLGITGFIASCYTEGVELTSSKVASVFLSFLPTYFNYVITVFMGGNRLQGAPTAWPLAFRLAPRATALKQLIAGFPISWFSSGSAQQFVFENIGSGPGQDFFDFFANWGIKFFGWAALWDLNSAHTQRRALEFGTPDEKYAVQIGTFQQRAELTFQFMDPDKIEADLTALATQNPEGFKKLFPGMSLDGRKETVDITTGRKTPLTDFWKLKRHRENFEDKLHANKNKHWLCQSRLLPPPRLQHSNTRSQSMQTMAADLPTPSEAPVLDSI